MPRDIQLALLAAVRRAGITGDATLFLSPRDAARLVAGLPAGPLSPAEPEHLDRYDGTADDAGVLTYRLDPALPWGSGLVQPDDGERVPIAVDEIIR